MKPLAELGREHLAQVRGVLTDIDDTLTTDGRLTSDAYAALERLDASGLIVIPITGRPAGWCDHIARMWPVSGVVGENGAFWMRYDRSSGKLVRRFLDGDDERAAHRSKLDRIGRAILAAVPGAALASDQRYRETDLAIDFREDVVPLADEHVDRIVAVMEAEGMTAKVSSIHVNGWFGRYDKLDMTKRLLAEAFDIDLDAQKDRFVFVGDSPNDAPMFAYFPLSVGVANIARLAGRIATLPAFVTSGEGGAGFVELAGRLVRTKQEPTSISSGVSHRSTP